MKIESVAHILLQPTARRIVLELLKEPANITGLEKKLTTIDPRLVGYHLMQLEEAGLIDSEYKIIKKATETTKGKAARYLHVNETILRRAMKTIKEFISKVDSIKKGEKT